MVDNVNQNIAMILEVETSAKLIKFGLREIQNLSGANVFYYIPLFMLSNGIERMMKCIICLNHYNKHNNFPDRTIFPKGKKGHNLKFLLNKITNECFSEDYQLNIPAAKSDIAFIKTNLEIRKFLQILSDFAESDRYHNLNVVLNDLNKSKNPDDEFAKLEMFILDRNPEIKKFIYDLIKSEIGYSSLNKYLVIYLEIFIRALSRLFTIGNLGKLAKQCSIYFNHYLFLTDDKLGHSDYSKVG
ncbi:MAG: hypothetical protein IH852_01215 [Bacteroidetes bacterium]|nr:hypothetical protein [Bacteroidota bacterium]